MNFSALLHATGIDTLLQSEKTTTLHQMLSEKQLLFAMEFGLDPYMVVRDRTDRVLVFLYFIPLMIIGILGNGWLIWSVVRILFRRWFPANLLFRQIALYILTLSIVDLCMVLSIPMLLSYMVNGHWRFGSIGCKLFFAVENVNKLLSVMVLATMSFERFIAVCRPFQWLGIHMGTRRAYSAVTLLIGLLLTVALLCAPMVVYAQVHHYMIVHPNGSIQFGDSACGSHLPDRLMSLFILYMLLFGFIVPLPLIACCYLFIVRHLQRKPNGFVSSYTARAVRSILRVVIFHFLCWTPFWGFVMLPLFPHFRLLKLDPLLDLEVTKYIRMASSFLPYLNCSLNWVFYGMMNRQLRESSTLMTGRHSCMPLSSLPRSATTTSVRSKRTTSIRSVLTASSRL